MGFARRLLAFALFERMLGVVALFWCFLHPSGSSLLYLCNLYFGADFGAFDAHALSKWRIGGLP